jgi:crotonobetainyl-CoA:carnitine CoA-transferase CaiB-like acyl-CoA transferase
MLPLTGVQVVELASNVAGPFATTILHDLGATVTKIERLRTGDVVRAWPPFDDSGRSAPFTALNRGKRSLEVDVATSEGRQIIGDLLARSDVFVTSLRPGKLDALGLGTVRLAESHPSLVVCEISGYGPTGPLAQRAGYDAILQAFSGIMAITGHPDGPPARVGTAMLDCGTGMWAAMGCVCALLRRTATGAGGVVHPSLLGTAIGFLTHHIAAITMADVEPQRIGTAQHNTAPYEALTAADGPVMVGVSSEALWHRLCEALSCPELIADLRFASNSARVANRTLLVEMLNAAISGIDALAVVTRLRAAGVPASRIRSPRALLDDEQVDVLGLIQNSGVGARLATAAPVLFDGELVNLAELLPPTLGEHTTAVLTEIGRSEEEIHRLREAGAITPGRA